jgi:hypothetical protein
VVPTQPQCSVSLLHSSASCKCCPSLHWWCLKTRCWRSIWI